MPNTIDAFEKEYREACFYSWYNAGCPSNIKDAVPEAEDGRKPTIVTLKRWARDEGWQARADDLDAQLALSIDTEIIQRKRQDYLDLAEHGRTVLTEAMGYLKEEGFDSAASAVRGISVGADMISKYSRAAEMVDAVLGKTDKQIEKEIFRLLDSHSADTEAEDVDEDEEDDNSE
jgi:hypothetical protein